MNFLGKKLIDVASLEASKTNNRDEKKQVYDDPPLDFKKGRFALILR
jgi:hypothetical protein